MKQLIELEWDEKKLNINTDYLKLCLYSKIHTEKDLLKVKSITDKRIYDLQYILKENEKLEDTKGIFEGFL